MEWAQLLGMIGASLAIIGWNMEEVEVEEEKKPRSKKGSDDDSEPKTKWVIVNWK